MAVNIVLRTDFDSRGLKEAERGLDKFKGIADKAFRGVAIGTGIAAAAFGKLAMDSIRQASNLEESTNAVNVAFGKSAQAVLAIGANSAESLGLAKNEFNEAAVRFSAFAERIVGDGGDASQFIGEVTQRAADFASVFNIEVSEALRVFQSGLAGEAEPLKRFGINLLQSEVQAFALANGIIEVGEQMTETEKVQARYGLLLESTAKTAGDFANTSDGLANSQRILKARFTDLQAEIGTALLPAFTDLFKAVADQVMPEFEKLGDWLKSPDGQKAIQDLANTITDLTTRFIQNIPQIINAATQLAVFVTAVKIATTAIQLATTAKLLFNTAMAFPLTATALMVTGLTVAFQGLHIELKRSREAATGLTGRTAEINAEFARLKELVDNNIISFSDYTSQIKPLIVELSLLEGQFGATSGEANRFNNLNLNKVKNQVRGVNKEILDMYHSGVAATAVFEGVLDPRTGKGVDFTIPRRIPTVGSDDTGPSAFEQAGKRVQELLKSSQKQIQAAEKTFLKSQITARQNYADGILRVEKEFTTRFEQIVQQSQDRLRSAFRSAVEVNIASLFDLDESKSVDALVQSLTDKLASSRQLLANSAQLASQGFSQTFIEQVVSAGTQSGNELAAAILNSTPETQAELKRLFGAIETEASSGMDSLASQIYADQGLATDELARLYKTTQQELNDAMLEQQNILNQALKGANETLVESLRTISQALDEQLDDMDGKFGGMEDAIDSFTAKIDELIEKYKKLGDIAEGAGAPAAGSLDALLAEQQRILDRIAENQAVLTGGTAGPGARDWAQKKLDSYQEQLAAIIAQIQAAQSIASLAPAGASIMSTSANQPASVINNNYTVNASGAIEGQRVVDALKRYQINNGSVNNALVGFGS